MTIKAAEMKVTRKILPLLTGNFPRMIQYCSAVRMDFGLFGGAMMIDALDPPISLL